MSSLDVSIQAQVLNLLKDLQAEFHLTYLFITHDLSVVKFFSDKIAVMYLGQLVETADSAELFRQPLHPYSQALLSAIPIPSSRQKMQRVKLIGELQSPIDPEPGCRFAKRCLYAREGWHRPGPGAAGLRQRPLLRLLPGRRPGRANPVQVTDRIIRRI